MRRQSERQTRIGKYLDQGGSVGYTKIWRALPAHAAIPITIGKAVGGWNAVATVDSNDIAAVGP
jgi:hypothetical protein